MRRKVGYRHRIVLAVTAIVVVLLLLNGVLWLAYRGRTYPHTVIGADSIGSVAFGALAEKVDSLGFPPDALTLTYGNQKTSVTTSALGVALDEKRTIDGAKSQRSVFPLIAIFKTHHIAVPVAVNDATFNATAAKLSKVFRKQPVNPRLSINGGNVQIVGGKDGYTLDTARLGSSVVEALDKGSTTVSVPVSGAKPGVSDASLRPEQQKLQQQINTDLSFTYNGDTKRPARSEIASWYVQSGSSYAVDDSRIKLYVAKLGDAYAIRVKDAFSVAQSVSRALTANQKLAVTLSAQTAIKTYKYCVAVRGVDTGVLTALQQKLLATYNDPRGWNLDGKIAFEQASSGCDYTVWMSAPSQMTSFGTICDPYYNCQVGDNVILNYDRWRSGTAPWNATGGSIDDYRTLMINHETGHRLGFLDNYVCPAVGHAAPVMMQQSVNLHGCVFNVWPLQSELSSLANRL